ncbi:hypothetical protein V2W45_38530 [Cenococcum geophilum]
MLEERKCMRQVAKEIRLQEQRIKAAEQEEAKYTRQAATQLKKDLQLAKKGKQKAPISITSDEYDEGDTDEDESVVEVAAPTPARSRRSRAINLPKRFRM